MDSGFKKLLLRKNNHNADLSVSQHLQSSSEAPSIDGAVAIGSTTKTGLFAFNHSRKRKAKRAFSHSKLKNDVPEEISMLAALATSQPEAPATNPTLQQSRHHSRTTSPKKKPNTHTNASGQTTSNISHEGHACRCGHHGDSKKPPTRSSSQEALSGAKTASSLKLGKHIDIIQGPLLSGSHHPSVKSYARFNEHIADRNLTVGHLLNEDFERSYVASPRYSEEVPSRNANGQDGQRASFDAMRVSRDGRAQANREASTERVRPSISKWKSSSLSSLPSLNQPDGSSASGGLERLRTSPHKRSLEALHCREYSFVRREGIPQLPPIQQEPPIGEIIPNTDLTVSNLEFYQARHDKSKRPSTSPKTQSVRDRSASLTSSIPDNAARFEQIISGVDSIGERKAPTTFRNRSLKGSKSMQLDIEQQIQQFRHKNNFHSANTNKFVRPRLISDRTSSRSVLKREDDKRSPRGDPHPKAPISLPSIPNNSAPTASGPSQTSTASIKRQESLPGRIVLDLTGDAQNLSWDVRNSLSTPRPKSGIVSVDEAVRILQAFVEPPSNFIYKGASASVADGAGEKPNLNDLSSSASRPSTTAEILADYQDERKSAAPQQHRTSPTSIYASPGAKPSRSTTAADSTHDRKNSANTLSNFTFIPSSSTSKDNSSSLFLPSEDLHDRRKSSPTLPLEEQETSYMETSYLDSASNSVSSDVVVESPLQAFGIIVRDFATFPVLQRKKSKGQNVTPVQPANRELASALATSPAPNQNDPLTEVDAAGGSNPPQTVPEDANPANRTDSSEPPVGEEKLPGQADLPIYKRIFNFNLQEPGVQADQPRLLIPNSDALDVDETFARKQAAAKTALLKLQESLNEEFWISSVSDPAVANRDGHSTIQTAVSIAPASSFATYSAPVSLYSSEKGPGSITSATKPSTSQFIGSPVAGVSANSVHNATTIDDVKNDVYELDASPVSAPQEQQTTPIGDKTLPVSTDPIRFELPKSTSLPAFSPPNFPLPTLSSPLRKQQQPAELKTAVRSQNYSKGNGWGRMASKAGAYAVPSHKVPRRGSSVREQEASIAELVGR